MDIWIFSESNFVHMYFSFHEVLFVFYLIFQWNHVSILFRFSMWLC